MLSYTVHCEIDDKLTTQYRTLNGAPDFKQSKDENGNILLDVAVKDIETNRNPTYGTTLCSKLQ